MTRRYPMLTRCVHCGAYINPEYGAIPPGVHAGLHTGDEDDPRAPGDYDNICDECNYGKDLHGGPEAELLKSDEEIDNE